ncbi:sensor histidine kinase [Taibaiella chishuiensis]|uniref:histidine kinase n=1 Tax=Taibaiella chishuiensis TaxID=1434707 RepID=A0A2P8DBX7_9BACT|nr:HAMP domain-containing sensor histidine kinase [Taibaiella chishuiensis]PSK94685.1 two-component system phosphate regulon sensor histidine kinase PhoR [Taibaiella chishuiensis]
MKNATIRLIFVLAVLSCAGIIATQTYWVQRAYVLEEKEFNLNVNTALRNVAMKIWEMKRVQPLVFNVVDQVSPDYFIVQINDHVESVVLEHFLRIEFEKRSIITDFEYGLYDCMHDTVMSYHYVQMSGSNETFDPVMNFPPLTRENYYFGVFFPHRNKYLTSQLSIWILSSLVLLCVLVFLGYVVFVILKQKRLSEVQKDFVNNMTHEFKTPLATIQLSAEVLKNPDIVQKPQRLLNYATIIDNEASQLALQVERVLQMAHAEKGEIQLRKEKIVWQDLLRDVGNSFESRLMKDEAKIHLEMPEHPVSFSGDKLHLKNAISNLVDNALKYAAEHPEVTIRLRDNHKEIRVEVSDNGIGIDKTHQKMLFRRFYRVPTGNIHDVKGFGLGLNYVRIIARAHGGEAICNSKVGKGSIFSLIFPKI